MVKHHCSVHRTHSPQQRQHVEDFLAGRYRHSQAQAAVTHLRRHFDFRALLRGEGRAALGRTLARGEPNSAWLPGGFVSGAGESNCLCLPLQSSPHTIALPPLPPSPPLPPKPTPGVPGEAEKAEVLKLVNSRSIRACGGSMTPQQAFTDIASGTPRSAFVCAIMVAARHADTPLMAELWSQLSSVAPTDMVAACSQNQAADDADDSGSMMPEDEGECMLYGCMEDGGTASNMDSDAESPLMKAVSTTTTTTTSGGSPVPDISTPPRLPEALRSRKRANRDGDGADKPAAAEEEADSDTEDDATSPLRSARGSAGGAPQRLRRLPQQQVPATPMREIRWPQRTVAEMMMLDDMARNCICESDTETESSGDYGMMAVDAQQAAGNVPIRPSSGRGRQSSGTTVTAARRTAHQLAKRRA